MKWEEAKAEILKLLNEFTHCEDDESAESAAMIIDNYMIAADEEITRWENGCKSRSRDANRLLAKNSELQEENARLREALAKIAPTSCPNCGDRAIQQIAREALQEKS